MALNGEGAGGGEPGVGGLGGAGLELRVVAHAGLGRELRKALVDLCTGAYGEDFEPYFRLLGTAMHVVMLEGGRVVSHAAWVPREVRVGLDRRPLACAYVEAVATPVALQGRGLGSRVMRALPPLLGAYGIAALSPSEAGFYARLGWEAWRGPLFHVREGRRVATPGEEVMIHRLPGTPRDLDLAAALETDWREGDIW